MNWHETETRAQIFLSVAIMGCVLIGTYIVFSMSRREAELLRHVRTLSVLNEMQAKQAQGLSVLNDIQAKISEKQSSILDKQTETVRTQGETNKNLSEEIAEIRRRQDILKRVAERIGIEAAKDQQTKQTHP